MATLTRSDVTAILGQIDEDLMAAIMATQATPGELAKAAAWANNDEPLMNDGQPLPSGRVATLVELLEPDDDEQAI
jgi:hypothetical protein